MAGGRPPGSPNKDKPFRDALRMAISDAEGNFAALRRVAEALVGKAMTGDVAAIKEVADRLDGKVPQGITGANPEDPVGITLNVISGVPREGE